MEYTFSAQCSLTMEHKPGDKFSCHRGTDFNLVGFSENLDPAAYLDQEGLPNAEGSKVLTSIFVQALIGNIHACHQAGYRDSAEHLRSIISDLTRGFSEVMNIEQGHFEP